MSRILGFVSGALLVFGGLFYLLTPVGVMPDKVELELAVPPAETAASQPDPEPEPVPVPEESAETVVPQPESPQPAPPPDPAEVLLADQPRAGADVQVRSAVDIADEQALVEQALAAMQQQQQQQQAQPVPAAPASPDMDQDESAPADDAQWFAVWDPFHSELSANAFARRLERMTGLDYRVVRTDPAKYEVAVAFGSEEERVANIALIEEATGLRIAGGDLLGELPEAIHR